jgi:DNA-binding transcriptional ArsR family regulator
MAYSSVLDALGHPTRRHLFERLRQGPCSVNGLVQTLSITQPAVSQHLSVLKAAGLVRVERRGRQRVYSVDLAGLAELRAYVESFWQPVLAAYAARAAENPGHELHEG